MLGFPLLYFKGMRLLMFQLSGFYYNGSLGFPVFTGIRKVFVECRPLPSAGHCCKVPTLGCRWAFLGSLL